MMVINPTMKSIIDHIVLENIKPSECYPIVEEKTINGNNFWCVKDLFCVNKEDIKKNGTELTDFEWDGNEIYINSSDDLIELLEEALSILKQWEYQMKTEYTDTCFEIALSIDEGDEDITPSSTIKFYAIRNDYHIIKCDEINEYIQPVLVEQVGLELEERGVLKNFRKLLRYLKNQSQLLVGQKSFKRITVGE